MDTVLFELWQTNIDNQNEAINMLAGLGVFLVLCYLISYAPWLPVKWANLLRVGYEMGGVMLYAGIIVISLIGQ